MHKYTREGGGISIFKHMIKQATVQNIWMH